MSNSVALQRHQQLTEFLSHESGLIQQRLVNNDLFFLLLRNGKKIQLVVHKEHIGRAGQTEDESLIEDRHYVLKCIGSESLMNIHSHSVDLLKTL